MRCGYMALAGVLFCAHSAHAAPPIKLSSGGITMRMDPATSSFSFSEGGTNVVAANARAGVLLNGSPVSFPENSSCAGPQCTLQGHNAAGETLSLSVTMAAHRVQLTAEPAKAGSEVRFQTAGAVPGFGLADHAVYKAKFDNASHQEFFDTDISGFKDDEFLSGQGLARLVSNFVIYPRQRFAELLIDPSLKIVHSSADEIVQGRCV